MSAEGYARPARFQKVLEPHIQALIERGVIESYEYERGGTFVFKVDNYLRAALQRILVEQGVFPQVAQQLVAAYDEVRIMRQIDYLPFRRAQTPGALLVRAIQEEYPLNYPDDEPAAFEALLTVFSEEEIVLARRLAQRLTGQRGGGEPRTWPAEVRSVARFCLSQGIDPERV